MERIYRVLLVDHDAESLRKVQDFFTLKGISYPETVSKGI